MTGHIKGQAFGRPSLSFILLAILLAVLWMAGGASRADALGQTVVRAVAWAALVIAVVSGVKPSIRRIRAVLLLLLAGIVLVLFQLVPLPVSWGMLPGHEMLRNPAAAQGQSWQTIAIVPDGAVNAVLSLVVPLAVLLLAGALGERERAWLPLVILVLVTCSTMLGLLQLSQAAFNNPFINDGAGEVSGNFANRNHFALFLSCGCLVAPVWAFAQGGRPGARALFALGLVSLLMLSILATGSRAGILTGVLGIAGGVWIVRKTIRRRIRGLSWKALAAIFGGVAAIIVMLVMLSIAAGRAVSIDRSLSLEVGADIRALGLPAIMTMVGTYFPFGAGFGSFDAIYRIGEPLPLLGPSYLNHAHNDFVEVALEGGILGLALLAAASGWWLIRSISAWRSGSDTARLGSAMLFLILLASAVDYPARTPMIMATIVIAALWLSEGTRRSARSALPAGEQQL